MLALFVLNDGFVIWTSWGGWNTWLLLLLIRVPIWAAATLYFLSLRYEFRPDRTRVRKFFRWWTYQHPNGVAIEDGGFSFALVDNDTGKRILAVFARTINGRRAQEVLGELYEPHEHGDLSTN